ncbi:hypothetical protein D3C73_417370 [compost metagenome]
MHECRQTIRAGGLYRLQGAIAVVELLGDPRRQTFKRPHPSHGSRILAIIAQLLDISKKLPHAADVDHKVVHRLFGARNKYRKLLHAADGDIKK